MPQKVKAFEWHEDGGDYIVTNYEVGVIDVAYSHHGNIHQM